MSIASTAQALEPPRRDPPSPADQAGAEMRHHRNALLGLLDITHGLAAEMHRHIISLPAPGATTAAQEASVVRQAVALAGAFDRACRTIRRIVHTVDTLGAPKASAAPPGRQPVGARERPGAGDAAIRSGPGGTRAERCYAERAERRESPDWKGGIDDRPMAAVIADLCRDLGRAQAAGSHAWKRCTPGGVTARRGSAAGPRAAASGAAPPGPGPAGVAAADPGQAGAVSPGCGPAGAAPAGPGPVGPVAAGPGPAWPGSADTGPADTGPADPKAPDPEPPDPEAPDPDPARPAVAGPAPAGRIPVSPDPAGFGAAGPAERDSGPAHPVAEGTRAAAPAPADPPPDPAPENPVPPEPVAAWPDAAAGLPPEPVPRPTTWPGRQKAGAPPPLPPDPGVILPHGGARFRGSG